MTCASRTLPTEQPTKRQLPTGGVTMPIQRLKVIITPKCTGSTPSDSAIGRKIGVKMRMAGVMSMKKPTTSKIRLMVSRMMTLFSERARMASSMMMGMSALAIAQLMPEEQPISSMTMALVTMESKKIFGRSLILISR